jgi:hypothetical protein
MSRTRRPNDPFDYHDPTAGMGGAPPARSALGLRLVLASFGVVVCSAGAVAFALVVVAAVLAAVAMVDIAVVIRRLRNEQQEQR